MIDKKFVKSFFPWQAKYKLAWIPFLLSGVGGNANLMLRDGLHPNAEGARHIEATVMKTLAPLLK